MILLPVTARENAGHVLQARDGSKQDVRATLGVKFPVSPRRPGEEPCYGNTDTPVTCRAHASPTHRRRIDRLGDLMNVMHSGSRFSTDVDFSFRYSRARQRAILGQQS